MASQSNAIEHVDIIVADIQDHIDKKSDFVGFILIAIGIEYLGSFLDEKPFTDFGQSASRFKNGLRFFKNNWYKNNSDFLFQSFRGPLVHQYRIGAGLLITSFCKNKAPLDRHLAEYEGSRILVLEQLFEDYKQAVKKFKNEVAKKNSSFNQEKMAQAHQTIHDIPFSPATFHRVSGSTMNVLDQTLASGTPIETNKTTVSKGQ